MKLSIASASALAASLLFISTPSSAQAAQYYNCANAIGCKLVTTKKAKDDYTATEYPVVMAHGLGGWTKLFGLIDYFYGIPEELMKGGTDVYTTKTSAIHDSEYRGEQLLTQVKTIAALTGKDKVNLLGHSHGGHDIRYVAAVAPEYVASVTAVSSPEQGSKMADWVVNIVKEGSAKDGYAEGEFNVGSKIALALFKFVGNFMEVGSGVPLNQLQEQDGWKAVNALTTDYMTKFNAKFPAAMPTSYCGQPAETKVNGIRYYSFSGIGQITNGFDPSDYLLKLTSLPFDKDDLNDGLVSSCSSRLGYVVRDDYAMNHLDSVNQVLGLTAWGQPNAKELYRSQVNRLKLDEQKSKAQ
ncbi:MAG: triacylglycerol lipase [Psychrobacter sp.]|nr:triacylglycerol lipase [Psychrobacter sp.]